MRQKFIALLSIVFVMFTHSAYAGEQYIDQTGYAVSGYDVVSYWGLTQSVIGQVQPAPIPGKKSFTVEYNGAKWAFSTAENRDIFLAHPSKYAPAYNGHCAYGAAQGGKVPANPNLWRIVDGKLYLNINKAVVGLWERDISGNIKKADKNWIAGLEGRAASKSPIPQFNVSSAPL